MTWISVKDRLPADYQVVQVCEEGGPHAGVAIYYRGSWRALDGRHPAHAPDMALWGGKVAYWQPLAEAKIQTIPETPPAPRCLACSDTGVVDGITFLTREPCKMICLKCKNVKAYQRTLGGDNPIAMKHRRLPELEKAARELEAAEAKHQEDAGFCLYFHVPLRVIHFGGLITPPVHPDGSECACGASTHKHQYAEC